MRLSSSDPYDLCERISLLRSSVHKPCRDLRGRLRRRPSYMWATFDQGACCWRKRRFRGVILLAGLKRSILGGGERNLQGTRRCRLHRPWRAITQPVTDGWATILPEDRVLNLAMIT